MKNYLAQSFQIGILFLMAIFQATHAVAQDDPLPIIDWEDRLTLDNRLQSFGHDLMGDSIDTHIGTIVFNHTDVSLPGNSSLEVAVRRTLSQGTKYKQGVNVEFGDWQIDVPRITAITANGGWEGDRCSGSWDENFQPSGTASGGQIDRHSYSNGVSMEIPGQGSQKILKGGINPSNRPGEAYTVSDWYITCTNASDGGEGFVSHSPSGDKYYFTKFAERDYKRMGFANNGPGNINRRKSIFFAEKVEDKHGNYVEYKYDNSNRLTKIESNDGRVIELGYDGLLIDSVTANGRRWKYSYRDSDYTNKEWDRNPFSKFNGKVLHKVTRPDDLYWEFDLDDMQASAAPPTRECYNVFGSLEIRHPNGTIGAFSLEEAQHRQAYKSFTAVAENCIADFDREPDANGSSLSSGQGIPSSFEVLTSSVISVRSKTLSHSNIENAVWTFEYEEDNECYGLPLSVCDSSTGQNITTTTSSTDNFSDCEFCFGTIHNIGQYIQPSPAHVYVGQHAPEFYSTEIYTDSSQGLLDFTNHTKVTQPDGSEIDYYHVWDFEEAFGGKEVLRRTSKNNVELQRVETEYTQNQCNGRASIHSTGAAREASECPTHVVKTIIYQDGDTYTTELDYDTDPSSPNYSYGNPTQTKTYSNTSWSSTPRIIDTTYEHNSSKWVLGLTKTVSRADGTEITSYDYDPFGQITTHRRYGELYGSYDYYSSGMLSEYTDALKRRTYFYNYKRGAPERIRRPDNKYLDRTIDDNGWVTSNTDALGRVTTFAHDTMGRLKEIDPPGEWDNTEITYDFGGGGAVQTITSGQSRETITYDEMLRPILEQTQALDTGWFSYTNTKYDGLGRTTFKSQPSSYPSETKGVDYSYDGLGRIKQQSENVSSATTKYDYFSSHRRRVTDPSGAYTDYYSYGYGGPGNTESRYILKYSDSYQLLQWTTTVRDNYGQLQFTQQSGAPKGSAERKSHYYYYDSQQRLCRDFSPEGVATRYEYDVAGQMTAYAKGSSNSGCGPVASSAAKVSHIYDILGRLERVDYADTATPDIQRTYDAVGNVKTIFRSGVNWSYDYNELNLPKYERLTLDGRTFNLDYGYNDAGHLAQKILPSGHVINYSPDGLGRFETVKKGSKSLASNVKYYPSGAVESMAYGNGQNFLQSLNSRLLPSRLLSAGGGQTAIDLNYLYDPRGKVASITDRAVTNNDRAFEYDGMGRLTGADGPWGQGSFAYDGVNNLKLKTLGNRTVEIKYDAKNRVDKSTDSGKSGTRTFGYDDQRGNVTSISKVADPCIVTKLLNFKGTGGTSWEHTAKINTCPGKNSVISVESKSFNATQSPPDATYNFSNISPGNSQERENSTFLSGSQTSATVKLKASFSVQSGLTFSHTVRFGDEPSFRALTQHGTISETTPEASCIETKELFFNNGTGKTQWTHTAHINTCDNTIQSLVSNSYNTNLNPVSDNYEFANITPGQTQVRVRDAFINSNQLNATVEVKASYSASKVLTITHRAQINGYWSNWINHGTINQSTPTLSSCLATENLNYNGNGGTQWTHKARFNICTNRLAWMVSESANPNLSPANDNFAFSNVALYATQNQFRDVFIPGSNTNGEVELRVMNYGARVYLYHRVKFESNYTTPWVYHGYIRRPNSADDTGALDTDDPENEDLIFVYDYSDQPVEISGKVTGTFKYDGNKKRVRAVIDGKTIYNVYDLSGQLVHVHETTDNKATDYVGGPMGSLARISNDEVTYLHPDLLGSAQSGTNEAGNVLWRESFTPYGETFIDSAANDNLGGFTGHIKDKATGLNYMQARYYDPVIGRFLSVDPVTFMENGNPAMFNRYMYGNNDPVNMLDPDGRQSVLFGVEVDAVPGVGGAVASGVFTSKLPDGTKVKGRFFQERISVGRDGGASFTASRIMGGDIDNMVGLSTSLEIDGVTGPYGSQVSLEVGMTAGEQTFGLEVGVGVGEGNLGVTATHAFIRETSPDATQSDLRRSARHGEVRTEKALGKQIHTHTPYQGNPSCTTGACESFYDSIEKLD